MVTRQRDGHRHGTVLRVSATVGFIAGTIAVVGPSATVLAVGPVATTTVTAPALAPLLGESSTFIVTFDNTDLAAVGYGPYVDIRINTLGADGPLLAGDGFVSATMSLLGAPIVAVLPAGLPCVGTSVTHPLTGLSVPCAAGTRLFVFRLPFGSFTPKQPVAQLDTTVTMSSLADVGFPLSLSALPGFALGDSPTGSAVVVGSERTATVTPQIARLTKTYEGPEDETATGPSFPRRYVVSADLPKSVVFTSVGINDSLPDTHQFNSVTTVTPATAPIGEPSTTAPGGTLTVQWGPITGGVGSSDVSVDYSFFVPALGGSGTAVIDAATGDDANTVNDSALVVTYKPADTRDPTTTTSINPNTVDNHVLTAKSIAIQQISSITANTGSAGFNAGDTLRYTITGQISDFFSIGGLVLTDVLGDGQTFVGASATFTATSETATTSGAFDATDITVDTAARATCGNGTTTLTLRLSDALASAGASGIAVGGLVHGVADLGAATFEVTFDALVSDAYACLAADLPIDEGDHVDSNVTVTGDLHDEAGGAIGASEIDASTTSRAVETSPVTTTPYAKNGVVGTFASMTAGDLITYRVQTTSPSSDFEALTLTAFVPLPIFAVGTFSTANVTTTCATPAVGSACYGPLDTLHSSAAAPDPVVTTDNVSNSITFDYGTHDDPANNPSAIDLLLTVRVTDSAFRDGLLFTLQVSKNYRSSFGVATTTTATAQLVLAEPVLDIAKGVASSSNANTTFTYSTTRNPDGVTWFAPGAAALAPGFSGTVTSAGLLGGAPNANAANVDAADLVRFAIVIENTGPGPNGAFDVTITDVFPDGFIVPNGGVRLLVTDGAGSPLPNTPSGAFVAAPGTGGAQTGTITLIDGSVGAIAAGWTGGVTNAVGTNVAIITYELEVAATAVPNKLHNNTATLTSFSATDNGPNFIAVAATNPNVASVMTAPAGISKVVLTSDRSFTTGNRLAIGEVVTYQVVVTVPEGRSQSLTLTDTLDVGQAFVSVDSLAASSALVSSVGFPEALVAGKALVAPGRSVSFGFGEVTNADRDNAVAETITVEYRAIVLNVATNTIDLTKRNTATVTHIGTFTGSIDQASVTIVEPVLVTGKSATPTTADAGDVVTFVVDVRHTGQVSDINAFDVTTVDMIPAGMTYFADSLETVVGAAEEPQSLEIDGRTITATWLGLSRAPFQFGQFTYQATLDSVTIAPAVLTNTAVTTWTSLPGGPVTTSDFNTNDTERTGADGPGGLNDYRDTASASVSVANPKVVKALVATDDPNTSGNTMTIGEVGTYAVLVTLPEAKTSGFQIVDALPVGLRLVGSPSVITQAAASDGEMVNDFFGTLGPQTFSTASAGAVDTLTLDVGESLVTSDNDLTNNTFVVRFDAVVADVAGNTGDGTATVLANTASIQLIGGSIVVSNVVGVDVVEPRFDVVKTFSPLDASPGSTVLVTIAAQNVGLSGGFDSVVSDILDPHLDPETVVATTVPTGWTFARIGAELQWTARPQTVVGPGASATFSFTVALLATNIAGDTISNTASVVTTTRDGDVAAERIEPASDGVAMFRVTTPDLGVTISDGVATAAPGATLDYAVAVANTGGVPAPNVTLVGTLPTGTTFISATGPCVSTGGSTATTKIFVLGTITNGGAVSCTIRIGVNDPALAGTTSYLATVTASYDGSNGTDPNPFNNSSVDNDTIIAHPAVSVTKNDGVASLGAGAASSYVVTVANNGHIGATNVLITDTLPNGFVFTGCADGTGSFVAACTISGEVVSTTIATLAGGGAMATLTVIGTIVAPAPAALEAIVNTVHIVDDGANGVDPFMADNTATDTDSIDAAPDLVIAKTSTSSTVQPGGSIAYTITVTNSGTQDATGVVISDAFPTGVTPACATETPPAAMCDTGGSTWLVALLPVGASRQYAFAGSTAAVMPAGSHVVTNTATVVDDGSNGPDPTPQNNTATVDVALVGYFVDLAVTKTDGVSTTGPGSTLTYVIAVTNKGNIGASGVRVVDVIPSGSRFATAPDTGHGAGALIAGSVAWDLTTLAGGATATLTMAVTIDDPVAAGREDIVNVVGVSDDGFSGVDTAPGDNIADDTDTLNAAPDLVVTKSDGVTTVQPGGTLTYLLTVANVGDQDTVGVALTDPLPPGTTFVSASDDGSNVAGIATWPPFDLAAGSSRDFAVTLLVEGSVAAGTETIVNAASATDHATSGAEPNPADNTGSDIDTIIAVPDLWVTQSDGVIVATPGSNLTYTVAIGNFGSQGATGVIADDTIPPGTTFVSAADLGPGSAVFAAGHVVWHVGDVPSGATRTLDVIVHVTSPAVSGRDELFSTITVTDDGLNGVDATSADNTATDTDALDAAPDLVVTKTDGVLVARAGDIAAYTITVANAGTQDATGVVLTDTVPAGTQLVAAPGGTVTADQIEWPAFDLASGDSLDFTASVIVVDPIDAAREMVINRAVAIDDSTNGTDQRPLDNIGLDSDTLIVDFDVAIALTDGVVETSPGDTLTYVLTISNPGTHNSGVRITDSLPAGVTFVEAPSTDAVAAGRLFDSTVTWPVFDLAAGATVSMSVVVTVDASAPAGVEHVTSSAVAADARHGTAGPPPATDTDVLVAVPDLVVTKSDARTDVRPGDTLIYMITVTNVGDQDATGVVIADTLPPGIEFVSATDLGTVSALVATWPAVAVAGGGSVVYALTVLVADLPPPSISRLDNVVVAGDDGAGGVDPNPADNTATDRDLLDSTVDLAITNSNGTATSTPGTSSTWQLTITNRGRAPVSHFTVSGVLPRQLSDISYGSSLGSYDSGIDVWSGPALAGGESVTIQVTGLIAADATGTLTNEATVTPLDGLIDRAPGDNNAIDIDSFAVVPAIAGSISTTGSNVVRLLLPAVILLCGGVALLMASRTRKTGELATTGRAR